MKSNEMEGTYDGPAASDFFTDVTGEPSTKVYERSLFDTNTACRLHSPSRPEGAHRQMHEVRPAE